MTNEQLDPVCGANIEERDGMPVSDNTLHSLIASEMTLVSRDAHDRMDKLEARLNALEAAKKNPVSE